MRKILRLLGVMLACAAAVSAQTLTHEFAGVRYLFPVSHVAGLLTNNGSGTLSWQAGFSTNLVAFTTAGSCPTGWTEHTALRGRSPVGLVASGTNGAAIGTALTNTENRPTGIHTHTATPSLTLTDPGHSHSPITDPGHLHGGVPLISVRSDENGGAFVLTDNNNATFNSATTGITVNAATPGVTATATTTVNNSGSVAGTNSPYVQLLACVKS